MSHESVLLSAGAPVVRGVRGRAGPAPPGVPADRRGLPGRVPAPQGRGALGRGAGEPGGRGAVRVHAAPRPHPDRVPDRGHRSPPGARHRWTGAGGAPAQRRGVGHAAPHPHGDGAVRDHGGGAGGDAPEPSPERAAGRGAAAVRRQPAGGGAVRGRKPLVAGERPASDGGADRHRGQGTEAGPDRARRRPQLPGRLSRVSTRFGAGLGLDAVELALNRLAANPATAAAVPALRQKVVAARGAITRGTERSR